MEAVPTAKGYGLTTAASTHRGSPLLLSKSQTTFPEAALVDIGILVFDPGLPDDASDRRELESNGIFAEVRESEAIYVPVHLERTLQKTGPCGAVRVVPQ